jgi:hypothetical protein
MWRIYQFGKGRMECGIMITDTTECPMDTGKVYSDGMDIWMIGWT